MLIRNNVDSDVNIVLPEFGMTEIFGRLELPFFPLLCRLAFDYKRGTINEKLTFVFSMMLAQSTMNIRTNTPVERSHI